MIVVVQLVLALGVHAFRPLRDVPLARRSHGQVVRPRRLHRRPRQHPLDLGLLARRTSDLRRGGRLAENQLLEPVPTGLAGVFVDRYDVTLGPKIRLLFSSSMLHRYHVTVPRTVKRNKNGPSRVYKVHDDTQHDRFLAGGMIKDGHP
jgi:hypothetical protein